MGVQIQYDGGTKDDPTPVWTKMKYNLRVHTSTYEANSVSRSMKVIGYLLGKLFR